MRIKQHGTGIISTEINFLKEIKTIDYITKISKGTGENTCCECKRVVIKRKMRLFAYLTKDAADHQDRDISVRKQFIICPSCWQKALFGLRSLEGWSNQYKHR